MKRFLAAFLSLTLILSALCAVGVSAEDTYPKDGTVYTYVDDFSTYALDTQPSNWGGAGTANTVNFKVKEDADGERYFSITFNGLGLVKYYFDKNKDVSKYYIRYASLTQIDADTDTDYTFTSEFAYYRNGVLDTTRDASAMPIVGGNKGIYYLVNGAEKQVSGVEYLAPHTTAKLENNRYVDSTPINVISFNSTDKTKKDAGKLTYSIQLGGWTWVAHNTLSTTMQSDDYKDITAYNANDEKCKAAAAAIENTLSQFEIRLYNIKLQKKAKIYQDTVKISGGSADVRAKTDATGNGAALNDGDKVEVNNAFGTVYTITPSNGVVGRVKYNGTPVYFEQNGNNATVTIPGTSITQNGTLEVIIAENSEYVTNTYTANFVGGKAVNDVANPSLTSTDGRITLQGANALTGNEANIADSAAGTFAYNSNSKVKPDHRMGVVFNADAENPIYYACGRNYNWKLFHTGTYKPGYLQWSNPTSTETCKSLKDNKQIAQRFINGTANGPSGNGANAEKYVWNDNSSGINYIRFFAAKGGETAGNEYGYSIPGNIEILPDSTGVFKGFEYSETVMMHKISFEGEGKLEVKAASLNNFDNNKCDAVLTNGQSAKVEDLMKADFTVTAPEGKAIDTIKYVTYDGETEVGTELSGKQSGSFSIQPVEASGTIKVTYTDSTPVEPKVEYSGSNVEHNKEYTIGGVTKTSANSIIMYGTVTGDFDAYGFILSQFGADSVKTGEVKLAAETKSADGKFAIRVVGDGITAGKYCAAPYSEKSGATDKGTETDITVAATID